MFSPFILRGAGIILRCLLLCTPSIAQEYAVAQIPVSLLAHAHAVYRQHDVHFRVLDQDEAEMYTTFAVTILDKEAAKTAVWHEYETDFIKVKTLEGRVFDAAGRLLRTSKKSDVKEHGSYQGYAYSNQRVKVLNMEVPVFPFTVEFKVKTNIKGFFRIPIFQVQPIGTSVENAAFQLSAPPDYRFRWKAAGANVQLVENKQTKETSWRWSFSRLTAKADEPFAPDSSNVRLYVAPSKVSIEGYTGRFDDWKEIGSFFYEMNKGRDQLPDVSRRQVVDMVANLPGRRAKIDSLYRYMQQNCRYISIQIGIGGWQTMDAATVEETKYGDCKALSNYMKALLAAVGIRSFQALVYGDKDGAPALYDDVPLPLFNHAILYVPDEDLWLECTSERNPSGWLGRFTADRPALLLTPEGGELRRTPAYGAADNVESAKIDLYAAPDHQDVQFRMDMSVSGVPHDAYRYLSGQPRKDQEKYLAEETGLSVIEWQELTIACADHAPGTRINTVFTAGGYGARAGKRLFVPLFKAHPFKHSLAENKERQRALEITDAYSYADTVTLHWPPGYSIESSPKEIEMKSTFGSYSLKVEKAADHLTLIRHFSVLPVSVPAAQYNEVRQFYMQMAKADLAQAVLVQP